MRLILPTLAALPIALLLTGCDIEDFNNADRYTAEFHYTLKPTDRLSVDNFNGEIEIAGWDEPSIEVTGTKYAATQEKLNAIRIDVHESPAMTEIRASRSSSSHGNQGARFLIRAPRKTLTDRIVSSNGAVRIHDMTAAARIHTSNGSIRVENVAGGVDAETSNGAIELDSITGKLNLKTSNGRIRAEEIVGQCDAETSNGPVTLRFKDGPEGATRIHTSNGSVDVTLSKAPKNGVRAETSNGSITVDMPGNTQAHVNAHTSQSSISSDFDLSSSDKEKHHLEGDIGTGGPLIELTSHNGGIHLRKSTASAN
jgi:hypothetical protein